MNKEEILQCYDERRKFTNVVLRFKKKLGEGNI
jgi:hypothetical protein